MAHRSRILVLADAETKHDPSLVELASLADLVMASDIKDGLTRLNFERFDGIYVPSKSPRLWRRVCTLFQHEATLEELGEALAIVLPDLQIVWANSTFERWCGGEVVGRSIYEALGSPTIVGPDFAPLQTANRGQTATTRLQLRDGRFIDVRLTPTVDGAAQVQQIFCLCRDVSAEVSQQQKLDALHQAGRELAALNAEQLDELSVEERIETLKHNIRRLTHDLLHYDVIEIRILDPHTNQLKALLAEGMTPEAAGRELYAQTEGNGVTGYVAATGKTYLCNDTNADPHYLEGAKGARSSLTVALTYGDKVIGTFNVESPQLHGFGPRDVQFTEIFCRELSSALYTLDLLIVEKQTTATRSIEAINREVSLPVDEILTAATTLLERWIGHEEEMAARIRKILSNARRIKQSIQKVGEDFAPQVKPMTLTPSEPPCRLNLRVLVVDHDERVRRSAHSVLGRFGCIVETAQDGKEALTMAKLSTYDVMLADIRLPDLSGYEVYRALKLAQPSTPVILMTGFGYDSSHSLVKARQDGLKYVLYKPFRVDQLLEALRNSVTTTP